MGLKRICLLLLALALPRTAPAADRSAPAQIYFVAIGSQTYRQPQTKSIPKWPAIAAPENSATLVAKLLRQEGARFGILLTSDDSHAVTKQDMRQAIIDLKHRIRADHASDPIIFFYYIGHGLGDAFSQTLFLVPGDLNLDFVPSQTMTNALTRASLSNLDVVSSLMSFRLPQVMSYLDEFFVSDLTPDFLNPADIARTIRLAAEMEAKDDHNREAGLYPQGKIPLVPYVALFDNCYGGVDQDLVAGARKAIAGALITTSLLGKALTAAGDLAEQHLLEQLTEIQSDGLVLYAAQPGSKIGDFADPDDDHDPLPVGSLARRLMVALRMHRHNGRLSLRQLRDAMYDDAARTFGADTAVFSRGSPAPYSVGPPSETALDGVLVSLKTTPAPSADSFIERTGSANVSR